jgi:hypothetical protein
MNTNEKQLKESAFRSDDNPCYNIAPNIVALNVFADNGRNYLLPYAQFLFTERSVNPALEREPDAPPEKMVIHFAQAEIVVLGSGLSMVEAYLQEYELKFVKSADRRFAGTAKTHVAVVTLTLTNENV